MSKRPPKVEDVKAKAEAAVNGGTLRKSDHALKRMGQRKILDPDVDHVLLNGFHEKKKDAFSDDHGTWKYSIKGKDIDRRNIRLIVVFEDPNTLLITAIDLDSKDHSE